MPQLRISRIMMLLGIAFLAVSGPIWINSIQLPENERRIYRHIDALGGMTGGLHGRITSVDLAYTSANDQDVFVVLELPNLTLLSLDHTLISDKVIDRIVSHPTLQVVSLYETPITQSQVQEALKNYPDSKLVRVGTSDLFLEGETPCVLPENATRKGE